MEQEAILKLPAGRDLDGLVALEVMGYIWMTHWLRFSAELAAKWIGTPAEVQASGGVYTAVKAEEWHSLKLRDQFDEAVPAFSTDDGAATAVIARLQELGWSYAAQSTAEGQQVSLRHTDGRQIAVTQPTVAAAVAKAALLAAGASR